MDSFMSNNNLLTLYSTTLKQILTHPPIPGNVSDSPIQAYQKNPLCGDAVTLGVNQNLSSLSYQVEGCSLCLASTYLLADYAKKSNIKEIESAISYILHYWDQNQTSVKLPPNIISLFNSLNHFQARRPCVLLPWHCLAQIYESLLKR